MRSSMSTLISKNSLRQLRKFDLELEPIKEFLYEYPITFAPSYPYEENSELPNNYMSTRCPSWCDRVLISPAARKLIVDDDVESEKRPIYGIIGENICMGDHKVSCFLL